MPRPIFPTSNTTDGRKAKLVFGICARTGYGMVDGRRDPAAWAWWDAVAHAGNVADPSYAAAEAHYGAVLTSVKPADLHYQVNPLATIARAEIRRERDEQQTEIDL